MTAPILTIAIVLALFAEGKYIVSVIQGRSKPNFSGWLIFTVSMVCVLVSAYTLGARDSIPLIATFTFLHFLVALLSLKYGIVRFTSTDKICLLLSVFALFLWWQTTNPWYALILNILIDMFGFFTIAKKLYRFPGTEDRYAWTISTVGYSLNLIIISQWIPQEYLFTLSNVLWCGAISLLSFRSIPILKKRRNVT